MLVYLQESIIVSSIYSYGWCTSALLNGFGITVGEGTELELWDKWALKLFLFPSWFNIPMKLIWV